MAPPPRHGLAEPKGPGALGESQLSHPEGHRPAGDQEDLPPRLLEPGHRLHQRHQTLLRRGTAVVGHHLRPQLDHQPPGRPQRRTADGLC
jgi:hypothetical protein